MAVGIVGFAAPAYAATNDSGTPSAQASEGAASPNGVGPTSYYEVNDKKTVSTDYTNKSNVIASCKVASNNVTCSISHSEAASVSVQLALNVSRGTVTSGLNITSNSTVTTTVSCTSPKMTTGQVFDAWPRGTRYSYTVTHFQPGNTQTSGTLYAFVPKADYIACGVV